MNRLNKITKLIVDILFYIGILCVISVPFTVKYISGFYGYNSRETVIFAIMLIITGIAAVYILYEFKRMFRTLVGGNPFVAANVNSLKRMAVSCVIITAVYLVKCFMMFTFATVVIVIVFGIGTLFCLVLKDLFRQAVEYKEENDLTV
ncbi:MAG: DUF2975 domain-containing protein [Oscillospiraceae bacterium]|nr:DUF2975 domain-containing protein [Oscillospiraceae bacterium]